MANPILKADVLALAPLLSISDAAWVQILAFVNSFIGLDDEPSLRKLAMCLLAAHFASIAGTTGASGATGSVISETAGGLKRTYAQTMPSVSDAELNRTTYGQQYLAIMRMSVSTRGPFLV